MSKRERGFDIEEEASTSKLSKLGQEEEKQEVVKQEEMQEVVKQEKQEVKKVEEQEVKKVEEQEVKKVEEQEVKKVEEQEVKKVEELGVGLVRSTCRYLGLSEDTAGIILVMEQERLLFHSWENRPLDSLWTACPSDVWVVVGVLRPLLLMQTQESFQIRFSAGCLGEMSTALAKVDPRAGDFAGAGLLVCYQRLAGVDYRHRLLPLDQRRGVEVQEDVLPLVLGVLRGVVLSLGLTFKSEVLHKALKMMSPISSLRVEGPVSSDLIKQYTIPHTEAGGQKAHRCVKCLYSSRNSYDAKVHLLVGHHYWHNTCVLAGCGQMARVNLSGQAEHNAQHGKNKQNS